MALTLSNMSMVGKLAQPYISKAVWQDSIVQKGYVKLITGGKDRLFVPVQGIGSQIVQLDGCGALTPSSYTASTIQIDLETFASVFTFCISEIEQTWEQLEMELGANNSNLTQAFLNKMIELVGGGIRKDIENLLWASTGSGSGYLSALTGFTKQLEDNINGTTITGNGTGAVTKANVLGYLESVYLLIPEEVTQSASAEDPIYIYMNPTDFRKYTLALGGDADTRAYLAMAGEGKSFDKLWYADNIFVVSAPGLAANSIIAALKSNMIVATDLYSDTKEIRIVDYRTSAGMEEKIGFKVRFKLGVRVGFSDQVVLFDALAA
jgi:hypothetical protein